MKKAFSVKLLATSLSTLLVAGAVACKSPPSSPGSQQAGAQPLASSRARPIPTVYMPGAIPQDVAATEAVAATSTVKNRGKLGERLEGDVYYFRLLAAHACDAGGKVVGVEIELEAKTKLAVSPRDMTLGKGGMAFSASLELERKLPGCSPLLRMATLKKGETAKGFVLFDLPSPPPEGLGLVYQPTRWGGAGHVAVELSGWPRAR